MAQRPYNPQAGRRLRYELIAQQLEDERQSFKTHWVDLAENIAPRRPRWFVTDANRGDRKNQSIYDGTATLSLRILRSGMLSGLTSPARPWFDLKTFSPELNDQPEIDAWLYIVTRRLLAALGQSNLYKVLPIVYGDLGAFGTSAMYMEEDADNIFHFYSLPIGSYACSNNSKGIVDCFTREFRMTVRQLVEQFGQDSEPGAPIDWSILSTNVKSLYDESNFEAWVDVRWMILPNPMFKPGSELSKDKRYLSIYYEKGYADGRPYNHDPDMLLRERGYDIYPTFVARWEVTGEDTYGSSCPGMMALGDIKQLQAGENRTMCAVEKMVNPPLAVPSVLRNYGVSLMPGDYTPIDIREGQQGIRPIHEVQPRIQEMEIKQTQVRQRIKEAFYENLFLMLANRTGQPLTATETSERIQEKMLGLSPVLEQLAQDLLDPLVTAAFQMMGTAGMFPDPPAALDGENLRIVYTGEMAKAQREVGVVSLSQFTEYAGVMQQIAPDSADKVDHDALIAHYGDFVGLPPGVIVDDETVEALRQQRQEAMQKQQALESMQQAGAVAKDVGQAGAAMAGAGGGEPA